MRRPNGKRGPMIGNGCDQKQRQPCLPRQRQEDTGGTETPRVAGLVVKKVTQERNMGIAMITCHKTKLPNSADE